MSSFAIEGMTESLFVTYSPGETTQGYEDQPYVLAFPNSHVSWDVQYVPDGVEVDMQLDIRDQDEKLIRAAGTLTVVVQEEEIKVLDQRSIQKILATESAGYDWAIEVQQAIAVLLESARISYLQRRGFIWGSRYALYDLDQSMTMPTLLSFVFTDVQVRGSLGWVQVRVDLSQALEIAVEKGADVQIDPNVELDGVQYSGAVTVLRNLKRISASFPWDLNSGVEQARAWEDHIQDVIRQAVEALYAQAKLRNLYATQEFRAV